VSRRRRHREDLDSVQRVACNRWQARLKKDGRRSLKSVVMMGGLVA
jgi:hypothetical protein